ncbi:hypothetical protein ACHWQZ_G011346 [Mnemiopsis leidyi]
METGGFCAVQSLVQPLYILYDNRRSTFRVKACFSFSGACYSFSGACFSFSGACFSFSGACYLTSVAMQKYPPSFTL